MCGCEGAHCAVILFVCFACVVVCLFSVPVLIIVPSELAKKLKETFWASLLSLIASLLGFLHFGAYPWWGVSSDPSVPRSPEASPQKANGSSSLLCSSSSKCLLLFWGAAKGRSVSWVAKFKGDKNSECKLSNGWSQSCKVIKLLLSARK